MTSGAASLVVNPRWEHADGADCQMSSAVRDSIFGTGGRRPHTLGRAGLTSEMRLQMVFAVHCIRAPVLLRNVNTSVTTLWLGDINVATI
ncbi:hypothetical protein MTO96_014098 [Rhipicephalus appendiculatus]